VSRTTLPSSKVGDKSFSDRITAFALTLAVSLEAIELSTFVLIGHNRQAAFQIAKSDHGYETVDRLLDESIFAGIHELTEQDPHARGRRFAEAK